MPPLEVMNADVAMRSGYFAPSCDARGPICSALFHPDGYSLWALEAELGEGAELVWGDRHGDEVLYVLDGELDVQGSHCGPKDAAIVESGAAVTVRARTETRLVHFGPVSIDAPSKGLDGVPLKTGHGVHVVRAENARRLGSDDVAGATYYADRELSDLPGVPDGGFLLHPSRHSVALPLRGRDHSGHSGRAPARSQ